MAEVKGDDAAGRSAPGGWWAPERERSRAAKHARSGRAGPRRRNAAGGCGVMETQAERARARAGRRSSSPSSIRRTTSCTPRRRSATPATCAGTRTRRFPVHGMDRAMGLKDSRLGWIVLVCALTGLTGAFVMMHWMNGVDYPLDHRRQAGGCARNPPVDGPDHVRADHAPLGLRRGVRDAAPQPAAAAPPPGLRVRAIPARSATIGSSSRSRPTTRSSTSTGPARCSRAAHATHVEVIEEEES